MLEKKRTPSRPAQRTTRHEPPTLEEAIAAAQGLTDDVASQIEIAAQLMGMDETDVKAAMPQPAARAPERHDLPILARKGAPRVVVVERKPSRIAPR
jgi:protein involved in polysaccharide export with SLBB domain